MTEQNLCQEVITHLERHKNKEGNGLHLVEFAGAVGKLAAVDQQADRNKNIVMKLKSNINKSRILPSTGFMITQ